MTRDLVAMASLEPLSSMLPPHLSDDHDLTSAEPRKSPKKPQTSPSRAATLRDPRLKRVSPRSVTTAAKEASSPKVAASAAPRSARPPPASAGRPLVPSAERRSHGEKGPLRARKGSDAEKWEVTPDGGSAGREGRHFAVANVGNNGRIYLRPTVRPVHQRYPQPSFVFPITPPGAGGLSAVSGDDSLKGYEGSDILTSQWTPTPEASPIPGKRQYFPDANGPVQRPVRHRRAVSDSTIQEPTPATESDSGAFKIVISKPSEEKRPKTMEDVDPAATPVLDVRIPSWRIGTPWFTSRGPMLRGSSYAPTEEYRNSGLSLLNRSHNELATPMRGLASRRPSALQVSPGRQHQDGALLSPRLHSADVSSPRSPRPLRATFMSTHLVIEPSMFDALTFKPACDERLIVRYASVTGAVTAATPPRLVAEITSPSFLDYELISDFFLTYRSFLEPQDLLRMLVARLRWAVARDDEIGMVVRVRTFVALRHWILNYFMDDFVVDYSLRVTFCNLLNDFVNELSEDGKTLKVQLKILTELKKCWRRVCAHYWDGPDFDDSVSSTVPIAPGGIAGHRDPNLDPAFWDAAEQENQVPQLESFQLLGKTVTAPNSFFADVSRAGHVGDTVVTQDRPRTPENQSRAQMDGINDQDFGPGSPYSMASMDVVSCSFPSKALRSLNPHGGHPLAAHPASGTSIYNQTGPIAQTPRTLVGKRVRPKYQHERNNSLTDSLREHDSDKLPIKDKEFLLTSSNAGSLLRGNILPPAQGFVDFPIYSRAGHRQRQTTLFYPHEGETAQETASQPAAMSSNGMRKLIGSVRRALSTRGQNASASTNNLIAMGPIGPQGATTNRLPGTAVVPTERSQRNGARPPVRIDLLGAEVAEDFKKAVREDAAADAEQYGLAILSPPKSAPLPSTGMDYSAAHIDTTGTESTQIQAKQRPLSDTGMTVGSKSIVIVDDTVRFNLSGLPGALPTVNSSVEDFGDKVLPTGADPTPPHTPPSAAQGGDTPRRSSFLLNQHVIRPSLDDDPLPPFVPDLATLGRDSSDAVRQSEDEPRLGSSPREHRAPPVSGFNFHMHRRNKSTRTQQSLNSILNQRRASLSSGLAPPSMIQSIGATTYSEGSLADNEHEVPVPEPLRVLRRRPGGNLRKATNVGELDYVALRRSRSVGSLTTYSDSIRSFMRSPPAEAERMREPTTSDFAQDRSDIFSLGQLTTKTKKNDSFFDRRSSQPIMRPSFEAEAQRLAQIPDDEDEVGIEAALLKLEGKYEKKSPRQSDQVPVDSTVLVDFIEPEAIGVAIGDPALIEQEKRDHRHRHVDEGILVPDVPEHNLNDSPDSIDAASSYLGVPGRPVTGQQSFLSEGSHESYSSLPLLERGLNDDMLLNKTSKVWTDQSIFQGSDDEGSMAETEKQESATGESVNPHLSFDFIHKTDSLEDAKPSDAGMSHTGGTQSFLNDESGDESGDEGGNQSDLSSELSLEDFDARTIDSRSPRPRAHMPIHPLGEPSLLPMQKTNTLNPVVTNSTKTFSEGEVVPELHVEQLSLQRSNTQSENASPAAPCIMASPSSLDTKTSRADISRSPVLVSEAARKYSAHLPFILAFESEVLAQQFTLIEKDALNEIDWKDLIEMNWKNGGCTDYRSWVDFLRNTDARGVEVVVARFNIMVKWAISEVVLTQDIEERARCIIKYIHIAAHCRTYRNFATLAQITIALCSNEVARLPRTWAMVPASDMKTLRELEMLVTPTRNFYNLRAEMEAGSDAGCIPFVGIYTHDLLFNAQRPSEIASSPTTPPLINFERCRIGAAVVKTLLRLLEASSRYDFHPIEGITERCLWMGALSDDDIRRHSENLE